MEENEIINNTEVFKSYLCDYNDAYILVRDDITAATAPTAQVPFNNCAPFIKCITKINEKTADDAEDLNLVMPMYNLIKCRSNYSEATGRYDFIHDEDEATNFNADIVNNNFKSFKYKAKLLGNTVVQYNPNHANGILKNSTIAVPLKYLSNFWRSLEIPLINCKVELKLKLAANDIFKQRF